MLEFSSVKRAYLAGFLDGDGSIYVRAKPNASYRYGYQVAPYIVLFQSAKGRKDFEVLCRHIGLGRLRERNDGVLEYTIGRIDSILTFLRLVKPHVILKKRQVVLMEKILEQKKKVTNITDFQKLLDLIQTFEQLNYSKRRKVRVLTP